MKFPFVAVAIAAIPLFDLVPEAHSASADGASRFIAKTTPVASGLLKMFEGHSMDYSSPGGHPSIVYFETTGTYIHRVSYESKLTRGRWSIAKNSEGTEMLCIEYQAEKKCFRFYIRPVGEYGFQSYAMVRQLDDTPTYELLEASIGKGVSEYIEKILQEEATSAELKGTGEDTVLADDLIYAYATFLKLQACTEQLHIPVIHVEDVAAWAKGKEAELKARQSETTLWKRAVTLASEDVQYFLKRDEVEQYDFCMRVQQKAGQYVANPVGEEKPF